jgi:hypothetical protein
MALTAGAAALVIGCGGSGGSTPTSPTASAPSGCSGSPITNVTIALGPQGGGSFKFTADVYGESVSGTAPPSFLITRNVVPCEYELKVQLLEASQEFWVLFGFPPQTKSPDSGGVVPSSVEPLEGPLPAKRTEGVSGCQWTFNPYGPVATPKFPITIRMKFRVEAGITGSSRCGG